MSIKSVCKTQVVTVFKNATLENASHFMQIYHVGCLVVIEDFAGKRIPCGIITDRDLALALGSAPNPQSLPVEKVMQPRPMTVRTSDGIFETITQMHKYGIKRMPVVDEEGSLYGLVSAEDILALVGNEIKELSGISDMQLRREKAVRRPSDKNIQM